jgi:formylglycine-generating enzyme required for sulfatase activity
MANQGGWDSAYNAHLKVDTAALLADIDMNCYKEWNDTPGANEALPMTCLSWYEAFAFCAWDGGFLPTEAEWHYAATGAAGAAEESTWPWCANLAPDCRIDCSYANYDPDGDRGGTTCVPGGGVWRVGSASPKGDGLYGHADLIGNIAEWTLDYFQSPYPDPCDDCATLTVSTGQSAWGRVDRGGSYYNQYYDVYVSTRLAVGDGGVRCARNP